MLNFWCRLFNPMYHGFQVSLLLLTALWPAYGYAQSQRQDIRPNAQRVIGDDLLANFEDITHEGAYNFTEDGQPTRYYHETHHNDGTTTYREDGLEVAGVWIIQHRQLCFVYDSAQMSGGCFRVYKVGNCFYYYSSNIPERRFELDENYWTARSVKAGETPNCEPALS